MDKHDHKECKHENLKYCSHCRVVYCLNEECNKEWFEYGYSWRDSNMKIWYGYPQYQSIGDGVADWVKDGSYDPNVVEPSKTACNHI